MNPPIIAVYDANVLYPAQLRDLLVSIMAHDDLQS
jgi:hypothetical protein